MLSTCIKLPFVVKTYVLSLFEWPFLTGFTVLYVISECISDHIPPQMKIMNLVIPILMHFCIGALQAA